VKLPEDYINALKLTNGGEGFISKDAYLSLLAVEELAPRNQALEVQLCAPGLLIFGSNGGGEAFGFDTRSGNWPVVQVPFVGMEWDVAWPMGESFNEFLDVLQGRGAHPE
jgi:hypothetical protein